MFLLAPISFAHTGIGSHNGVIHGFMHPLAGWDHILAMIAVGLWAVQTGGKFVWALPLSFVTIMVIGGLLGIIAPLFAFTEQGIAVSLLVSGVLIAAAWRLPLPASIAFVSLFALFHGYAHGSEMPQHISVFFYAAGFTFATVLLHLCGIGAAIIVKWLGRNYWLRLVGVAVAGYGGNLLLVG